MEDSVLTLPSPPVEGNANGSTSRELELELDQVTPANASGWRPASEANASNVRNLLDLLGSIERSEAELRKGWASKWAMFLPEIKKGVATMRSTMDGTPGVKTLQILHEATAGDIPFRAWLRRERAIHCYRIDDDRTTVDGMTPDEFYRVLRGEKQPEPEAQCCPDPTEGAPASSPAFLKAYRSFQYAEQVTGKPLTDDEAYNLLHENGIDVEQFDSFSDLDGYDLPCRETWKTYASKGRSAAGEKKKKSRAGRGGRSIVTHDEF